ncbi:MAG: hypothetical protein IKP64_02335 [Selenomonadaceae bacterium]|nr:hypothetical protein [Selenomonadaceae bacterium]
MREFFERNFRQIMFVIFAALVTIFAVLLNYMANSGYGNALKSVGEHPDRHYYHSDSRDNSVSNRQPWKFQKPASNHSSKSSHSSGHK